MRANIVTLATALALVLGLTWSARAYAQPCGATRDDDVVGDEAGAWAGAWADARPDTPPVSAVVAAAIRAAGLDHDPGRSFVRRARLAALLPWLTVRAGTNTSWHVDDDPNIGRGTAYEARATWRLDRLAFDGHELQVAAMTAARRRERRRLASRVIKAYFTWRRATMARSGSRADEAAAELDALTDGWFTEVRRTASETRTACGDPVATP